MLDGSVDAVKDLIYTPNEIALLWQITKSVEDRRI